MLSRDCLIQLASFIALGSGRVIVSLVCYEHFLLEFLWKSSMFATNESLQLTFCCVPDKHFSHEMRTLSSTSFSCVKSQSNFYRLCTARGDLYVNTEDLVWEIYTSCALIHTISSIWWSCCSSYSLQYIKHAAFWEAILFLTPTKSSAVYKNLSFEIIVFQELLADSQRKSHVIKIAWLSLDGYRLLHNHCTIL